MGWECLEAPEAFTGLSMAETHQPSLIILDLMMPLMDGFEFLVEASQRHTLRDIPVVILTAKELTESDRKRLVWPQVREVLRKGLCSKEEILRRVRQYARTHVLRTDGN